MFLITYYELPPLVEASEYIEFGIVERACGLKIYGKDILLYQFLFVLIQEILNGKYDQRLFVKKSGISLAWYR